VQSGDDDDCHTDYNFESSWIDGVNPVGFQRKGREGFRRGTQSVV
jgi:hypothetical protein